MTAETVAATKPREHTPTVSPTEPVEEGKGGEGGDFQVMPNLSLRFSRTCLKVPLRRCARRVATPI